MFLLAIADFGHEAGHCTDAYFAISAHFFRPLENCYRLLSVTLFCTNLSTFLILTVGLDRLLCILVPIR